MVKLLCDVFPKYGLTKEKEKYLRKVFTYVKLRVSCFYETSANKHNWKLVLLRKIQANGLILPLWNDREKLKITC